jgi:hypothetical protein
MPPLPCASSTTDACSPCATLVWLVRDRIQIGFAYLEPCHTCRDESPCNATAEAATAGTRIASLALPSQQGGWYRARPPTRSRPFLHLHNPDVSPSKSPTHRLPDLSTHAPRVLHQVASCEAHAYVLCPPHSQRVVATSGPARGRLYGWLPMLRPPSLPPNLVVLLARQV